MVCICFLQLFMPQAFAAYAKGQLYVAPEVVRETVEVSLPANSDGSFKAYMDYRAISDRSSIQYQLQQQAETDALGFRKLDGKYMIAVGTYYAQACGADMVLTLDDGKRQRAIKCVVADIKKDRHTDGRHQYCSSIAEFVVDTDALDRTAKKMGDVSWAGLQGAIVKIEICQDK